MNINPFLVPEGRPVCRNPSAGDQCETFRADSVNRIPKKSTIAVDRTRLQEFSLTPLQQEKFEKGRSLFNEGKFWEAHEAWEDVWKEREEEGRIFFQGIIQAAAAFHLVFVHPRLSGARRNILKSLAILDLFPPSYLKINVDELRSSLKEALAAINASDASPQSRISNSLLPRL